MGLGKRNWISVWSKIKNPAVAEGTALRSEIVRTVNRELDSKSTYFQVVEISNRMAEELRRHDPDSKVLVEYEEWKHAGG